MQVAERFVEGRTGNSLSMYTNGQYLFSYSTPIALRTVDGIWTHSTHRYADLYKSGYTSQGKYSMTTASKHFTAMHRAVMHAGYMETGELALVEWLLKHYNILANTWGFLEPDITEFVLWRVGTKQRLNVNPPLKQRRYLLSGRGETFVVNEKGEITQFIGWEKIHTFSHQWRIYAVTQRWNERINMLWSDIKHQLDKGKTVVGYLYDYDHGTIRFWGGQFDGKLPKIKLKEINSLL